MYTILLVYAAKKGTSKKGTFKKKYKAMDFTKVKKCIE